MKRTRAKRNEQEKYVAYEYNNRAIIDAYRNGLEDDEEVADTEFGAEQPPFERGASARTPLYGSGRLSGRQGLSSIRNQVAESYNEGTIDRRSKE